MKIGLLLGLFLLTLSLRADTPPPHPYDEREASRVYAGLLTHRFFRFRPGPGGYLIEAEVAEATRFPGIFNDAADSCFPRPWELDLSNWQTLMELRKQAAIARLLPRPIDIPIPHELVERDRLDAGWIDENVLSAGMGRNYLEANGILSISSVGFNESEDRALVFVSFAGVGNCGGAHYYTLEKHNGKWEIVEPAATCEMHY